MTSDTIVVRALYDAATYRDTLAQDAATSTEANALRTQADEYRQTALDIERTLIGMDGHA